MTNTRTSTRKKAAVGQKKAASEAGRSKGRPPLPTAKSGKAKTSSKASKSAVNAAKKAVVEEQVATEVPAVAVKKEVMPKRRVFTEDEDACICKAWVNISEDPVTGAGQKKDNFWARVHQKYVTIAEEEMEVQATDHWSIRSVQDRFTKLEKDVRRFNVYYAQIAREKDKSGWTPEMIITAAKTLYESQEGRPFRNALVARILHKSPKYAPLNQDQNNGVAVAQGRELDRPIGNKKARKMKLIEKLGDDSAAASAQTDALQSVANSASGLVVSFNRKRKVDSLHKQVDSYIKLGMTEKAVAILEEVQALEAKMDEEDARKPAAKDVPRNMEVEDGGDDEEEEEEEEDADTVSVVHQTGPHFTSACDDPLDEGDDGDDSSHPSQPSDDSRAVKNPTPVWCANGTAVTGMSLLSWPCVFCIL